MQLIWNVFAIDIKIVILTYRFPCAIRCHFYTLFIQRYILNFSSEYSYFVWYFKYLFSFFFEGIIRMYFISILKVIVPIIDITCIIFNSTYLERLSVNKLYGLFIRISLVYTVHCIHCTAFTKYIVIVYVNV